MKLETSLPSTLSTDNTKKVNVAHQLGSLLKLSFLLMFSDREESNHVLVSNDCISVNNMDIKQQHSLWLPYSSYAESRSAIKAGIQVISLTNNELT